MCRRGAWVSLSEELLAWVGGAVVVVMAVKATPTRRYD
jgi:hypothetical protein